MRKVSLGSALALGAVLAFAVSSVAQHGRPAGAGGGADMGAASGMGHSADAGMGGMNGMGHGNAGGKAGSQAPSSALSNPHLGYRVNECSGQERDYYSRRQSAICLRRVQESWAMHRGTARLA